jgi:hypothetical protein
MSLFEYALHGICIGNFGWTNVHSHGNFHTHILSLSFGDVVVPEPKVPQWNLGHHLCCSHMTTTRSALGILVVRRRLATHALSLPMIALAITISFVGNRVVLTCIKSAIPHEHVHRVVTSMCITPTLKNQCATMEWVSNTQFHKLSKSVSKIVWKSPH